MTKHLADKRAAPSMGRVKHFLRLSRSLRETWHRSESATGATRLKQFLRIARGQQT